MKSTPSQIRSALVTVLQRLKTANGFKTNLPDDKIYTNYSAQLVANKADSSYPKLFVLTDSGANKAKAANNQLRALSFICIFVCKKVAGFTKEPEEQCLDLLDDLEELMLQNDDLNGTVLSAGLAEFVTDSGVLLPEGSVVFHIETERITEF